MTTETIRYFISYMFVSGKGPAFANSDVSLSSPVRGMEDVRVLEQLLRDRLHANSVVVLSFTPLAS